MTDTLPQTGPNRMPVHIRRAVGVLCLSLLLLLVTTVLDGLHFYHLNPRPTVSTAQEISTSVFTFAVEALLVWKMSQGRNWARIIWLVGFIAGGTIMLLFLLSRTYRAEVFGSLFSGVVITVQTAIQFYATVLMFTSQGRTWFVRSSRDR